MSSRRKKSSALLAAVVGLFFAGSLLLAPAAFAQVGLEDITGAVEDVTGTVEDVGGAVEDVVGVVDETTDSVTNVAGKDGESGDPVSDAVNDTLSTVGEAVDEVEETVGPTVQKVTETSTIGDKPRSDNFAGSGQTRIIEQPNVQPGTDGPADKVRAAHLKGTEHDPARTFGGTGTTTTPVSGVVPATERTIETSGGLSELVRQAAEATKQLAFPLALTLIVVGFLLVQSRLDGSDPKLKLAPVHSEHDLLTFK